MNDYIIYRENEEELEHHGIKGMHWGVRRYQNPDGSLTAAGKLHYRIESVTGTYDPKGNNPYVSERRKKNRLKEIEEAEQRKQKEQKRSEIRKDLHKKYDQSEQEVEYYEKESQKALKKRDRAEEKAEEYLKDAKYLKKNYTAGRVATNAALSVVSSMAISAIADKLAGKEIDSGTFIRGGALALFQMPAQVLATALEAHGQHAAAERKYGLRK